MLGMVEAHPDGTHLPATTILPGLQTGPRQLELGVELEDRAAVPQVPINLAIECYAKSGREGTTHTHTYAHTHTHTDARHNHATQTL